MASPEVDARIAEDLEREGNRLFVGEVVGATLAGVFAVLALLVGRGCDAAFFAVVSGFLVYLASENRAIQKTIVLARRLDELRAALSRGENNGRKA